MKPSEQPAICMIVSLFYPWAGGAERQAQQLASHLVDKGFEVCVLTHRLPGLKAYEDIVGVPVYRVLTLGRGGLAAISYVLSSLLWLLKYGKKYRIVHCHRAESPAIIGIFAKLLYGKKVVVKISGGDLDLLRQSVRRRLLSSADVLVALTGEMRARLINHGFSDAKISIIPNGVDTDLYTPPLYEMKRSLREKLALPMEHKLAIFVGRLNPVKGLDTLIYAWRRVSRSMDRNDIRLLILGEGPEESFLKELTGQLGMEKKVVFLGRRDNVVKYLQSADVFVLPSLSEGLSNALLEAMACGLAVVATDIAGNNEVVVHRKNGLLVPPRDPGTLAKTLLTVLQEEELAEELGEEARRTVEEGYSLEKITERYVELYASLASDM